jgi:O-antigen/teichoic acid export membrane protein
MLGLSEAGLYNVATKFALPVAFVVSSVQTSWVAYKFQIAAEDDDPRPFFRSTFTYYVAALAYLWVGVSLWGPEALRLLTQKDFHQAALLVWAMGLIPVTQGMYYMLGTGIELGDNTRQYPLMSLAGLIAVVGGAFLMVPSAGPYGAALATALGWLVMSIVIYFLSQRRMAIDYDWPTLVSLAALATACVAAAWWMQSMPLAVRLAAATGLSLAFPAVAFALLCRSRDERHRMQRIWRTLVKTMKRREQDGPLVSRGADE